MAKKGFVAQFLEGVDASLIVRKMDEWEVDMTNLVGSIQAYDKEMPERAEALRKMAKAKNLLTKSGKVSNEKATRFFDSLKATTRIQEKRYGTLSKYVLDPIGKWALGLSAGALAWSAVDGVMDRYNAQLSTSLQYAGDLRGTQVSFTKALLGLDSTKAEVVAAMYGQNAESLYKIATEHEARYGEEISYKKLKHIGALSRMYATDADEIWSYIVQRQMISNDSYNTAVAQIDAVSGEFEYMKDELLKMGHPVTQLIPRKEMLRLCMDISKDTSGVPKNMGVIASSMSVLYAKAFKNGAASQQDAKAVGEAIIKSVKGDAYIQQRLGESLYNDIKTEASKAAGPNASEAQLYQAELAIIEKKIGGTFAKDAAILWENYKGGRAAESRDPRFYEGLASVYAQTPDGMAKGLDLIRDYVTGYGKTGKASAYNYFVSQAGLTPLQAAVAARVIQSEDGVGDIKKKLDELDSDGVPKIKRVKSEDVDSAAMDLTGRISGIFAAIKSSPIAKVIGAVGALILAWKIHKRVDVAMFSSIKNSANNLRMAAGRAALPEGGLGKIGTLLQGKGKIIGKVALGLGVVAAAYGGYKLMQDDEPEVKPSPPQVPPVSSTTALPPEQTPQEPAKTRARPASQPKPAQPSQAQAALKIDFKKSAESPVSPSASAQKVATALIERTNTEVLSTAKNDIDGFVDKVPKIEGAGLMAVSYMVDEVRTEWEYMGSKGYSVKTRMQVKAPRPLTTEEQAEFDAELDRRRRTGEQTNKPIYVHVSRGANAITTAKTMAGNKGQQQPDQTATR